MRKTLSAFVKNESVVWTQKDLAMQIEHQTKKLLAKWHISQANDDDNDDKDATCTQKKHNNQPNCGMHWWINVECRVYVDDDDDDSGENDSEEEDIEEEDEEKEEKNGLCCAQWCC